jgi:hypothetical protein
MRDTQREAEAIRLAAIGQLTPGERVRQALEFSEWVRQLALAGLRKHYPERSDLELVELMLGVRLVPDGKSRDRP